MLSLVEHVKSFITSGPGQEVHFPDKLNDHDVISETLKIYMPIKKPRNRLGKIICKLNIPL